MRVEKCKQPGRSVLLEPALEEGESVWPSAAPSADPLPWLAAERHKLLVAWNQTSADYPRDKGFHQLFAEQAERTPDPVAAILGEAQLTYPQLNKCSGTLAQ